MLELLVYVLWPTTCIEGINKNSLPVSECKTLISDPQTNKRVYFSPLYAYLYRIDYAYDKSDIFKVEAQSLRFASRVAAEPGGQRRANV